MTTHKRSGEREAGEEGHGGQGDRIYSGCQHGPGGADHCHTKATRLLTTSCPPTRRSSSLWHMDMLQ